LVHPRRISEMELSVLREGDHVLEVSGELPMALLGSQLHRAAALWVGHTFDKDTRNVGRLPPLAPREGLITTAEGVFWVDVSGAAFAPVQLWLRKALRAAIGGDPNGISALMVRVDADSEYTRAALFETSDRPADELAWFSRIERDNGHEVSEAELTKRFARLVEEAREPRVQALAVVAHAFRGSYAYATRLASDTGSNFLAFRDYFSYEAARLFGKPTRRTMVEAGRIIADERSPEAVIAGAVIEPMLATSNPTRAVVIDGFRHSSRALRGRSV